MLSYGSWNLGRIVHRVTNKGEREIRGEGRRRTICKEERNYQKSDRGRERAMEMDNQNTL